MLILRKKSAFVAQHDRAIKRQRFRACVCVYMCVGANECCLLQAQTGKDNQQLQVSMDGGGREGEGER